MIDISRTYERYADDGTVTEVVVRIFDSVATSDGKNHQVSITVTGLDPHHAKPKTIFGIDAIQALLGALQIAKAILEADPSHKAGRLALAGMKPEDGLWLSP
jgi:hypothetical protein